MMQEDREDMLLAAAKRKREASTGEGTSVSNAEMALRYAARFTTTGGPEVLKAGVAHPEGDGTRSDLPGIGSKRSKKDRKVTTAAEQAQGTAFAVPPAMPAVRKAGSMRKQKKKDR